MKREFTTAELKALGFSATMLNMLHACGTRTVGIMRMGDGFKARQFTNVYEAWSIARDVTRDSETLERFYKLVAKRGISLEAIPGLSDEITKALQPDFHSVYPDSNIFDL